MVKRFFDKEELLFAIFWIAIYVMGFSTADLLSERIGLPKLVTVCVGVVLLIVLMIFVCKNRLETYFGLCPMTGILRKPVYLLPLVMLSTVHLIAGLTMNHSLLVSVLSVISMCFVGFLEELIFRGFLFKSMAKNNLKAAVIVSSLTFGMGHAINLLLGAPLVDTLLQLVYASAVGFCYTAVFLAGGSIWPCIVSHALVNSCSVFLSYPTGVMQIIIAIVQTVIGMVYGIWLLKRVPKGVMNHENKTDE